MDMYYEEKEIEGMLCHRSDPNHTWEPFTREQLTERLSQLEDKFTELCEEISELYTQSIKLSHFQYKL